MRKILKIGGFTFGGILTAFSAYVGLLLYPGVLFANHVEYGNFTVYSDEKFGDDLKNSLDDIQAALITSDIYDPTLKHDIFFGHGNKAFGAIQAIRAEVVSRTIGIGPALTYNVGSPPYVSHIVTFRIPDFRTNELSHPEGGGSINLRQTLTHEVVHTLLMSKLGFRRVARSPMWKQEGYADYVAASTTTFSDPAYDIRMSVERILSQDLSWMRDSQGNFTQMRYGCSGMSGIRNEQGVMWPTCYYISRVLWEYLLKVKRLTFDEAMDSEITDTATLMELIAAYRAGNLG